MDPASQIAPSPARSSSARDKNTDIFPIIPDSDQDNGNSLPADDIETNTTLERRLCLKIDLRLCTIAGILCSLNLLDSGVISSASVTSMLSNLDLDVGNRYSVSIFIFTISSIAFQLPSTLAVRTFGPRVWFTTITFAFGLITMCTAFIQTWKQMIALRVLLGIAMSGIYPGLTYLISTWYLRSEQQTRFAFLQSGEVIVLATGSIVNFGLNQLDGRGGIAGWRYMFLVQGLISMVIGVITYFWIVDFPENAQNSLWFLKAEEQELAVFRINRDRKDVMPDPFTWAKVFIHAKDPKIYGFACMFFLLNLVSTSLSYFLPIILQSGMGFSENKSILLSAPPYYYAVIPVIISSIVGDRFQLRGPVIVFNCICLIIGFCMLGFTDQVTVRYIGTYLATGAYVSNWAALSTYQANNIAGQWKRAFTAAAVTAMNGAGGIAGSFIVKSTEAPRYMTAVWISIGSHILIVGLVAAFSAYFTLANRRADRGKVVLEGIDGFRYTL
ncbi:major facilitator superfamily domain-containing protein [Pseudomassariella vexata]|uniref:Major facilitator superfamily domain-containing protein n=1 Tax=Pseudomassariella vexata TaxID=1141098 RepID=A0A1Y2DNX3_9PEZI|nr:major facilitator superfamily domain-containing protein [Pseudomassariella vexata]ORY60972.1 major facilitator superfamily domain-containing protein [Pseudomassariella vexata]